MGFRELGCGVDGEVWRVCAEGVVVCFFTAVGHDLEVGGRGSRDFLSGLRWVSRGARAGYFEWLWLVNGGLHERMVIMIIG